MQQRAPPQSWLSPYPLHHGEARDVLEWDALLLIAAPTSAAALGGGGAFPILLAHLCHSCHVVARIIEQDLQLLVVQLGAESADWGPNSPPMRPTLSSGPSPIGSRPKSFTASSRARASIPACRRAAKCTRLMPTMILSTTALQPGSARTRYSWKDTHQSQKSVPSAHHLA
jgi:hypothetical protein